MAANTLGITNAPSIDTIVASPGSTTRNFKVIDGASLLLKGGILPSSIMIGNTKYRIIELPCEGSHSGLSFHGHRKRKELVFEGYNPQNLGHRAMANEILHDSQLKYKPRTQWEEKDKLSYDLLRAFDMIGW